MKKPLKPCEACDDPHGSDTIGAILCPACTIVVQAEIDHLRQKGRPVNVPQIARKILREHHSINSYLLRDIPKGLWSKAKHRAVDDKDNLRGLTLNALRAYLK